jgi:hypothetical protein
MKYGRWSMCMLLLALNAQPDALIDDFEDANGSNKLGWSWYFFSDVKDGGNSRICNAQRLPNGSYAAFKPDTPGYNSGWCARLKFALGDTAPVSDTNYPSMYTYDNFAALGTDMAGPGMVTNVEPAIGVSFWARSTAPIIVFFELVTSTIYDYFYYRSYFIVSEPWQKYSVLFHDSSAFQPPRLTGESKPRKNPLNLTKVQKMNWHVSRCNYLELPEAADGISNDTGDLYIDDIRILGVDSLPGKNPVHIFKYAIPLAPAASRHWIFGDLLGRSLPCEDLRGAAPGFYFWRSPQTLTIQVQFDHRKRP